MIRTRPGLIISEHRTGHILANAGIDSSNVGAEGQSESVLLWPENPDASARHTVASVYRRHWIRTECLC